MSARAPKGLGLPTYAIGEAVVSPPSSSPSASPPDTSTGFEGLTPAHRFLVAQRGLAKNFLPGSRYRNVSEDEAERSARSLGWDGDPASVPEAQLSEHALSQGWSLAEQVSLDEWRGNMRLTPYMEERIHEMLDRVPAVPERDLYRGLSAPEGENTTEWAMREFPVGRAVAVSAQDRPFASFSTSEKEARGFAARTIVGASGISHEEGVVLRLRSTGGLDVGSRNEREVLFAAHSREVLAHEVDEGGGLIIVLGEEREIGWQREVAPSSPVKPAPSVSEAQTGQGDALSKLQQRYPWLYDDSDEAVSSVSDSFSL